ncbi:hypothetical protein N9E05_04870 [Gammaproteobacteria bacterium]|nr:hypothetical protein [Gammaproteobacteria bacterium]
MSIQKNLLIGAGVLGVVLVTSQLVSGETVKDNDDTNQKDESSIICYSQTDGSTTTIIGVSPVCPTGYSLTPSTENSEDDVEKGDDEPSTQPIDSEKNNIFEDNKDVIIGASIGAISPIPGGSLVGAALGTKKGQKIISKTKKKAKKGIKRIKKLKFWADEETQTTINSSQSFMSEFF